jgi:hypothetical protein
VGDVLLLVLLGSVITEEDDVVVVDSTLVSDRRVLDAEAGLPSNALKYMV